MKVKESSSEAADVIFSCSTLRSMHSGPTSSNTTSATEKRRSFSGAPASASRPPKSSEPARTSPMMIR
jgi:hypothetical protein